MIKELCGETCQEDCVPEYRQTVVFTFVPVPLTNGEPLLSRNVRGERYDEAIGVYCSEYRFPYATDGRWGQGNNHVTRMRAGSKLRTATRVAEAVR